MCLVKRNHRRAGRVTESVCYRLFYNICLAKYSLFDSTAKRCLHRPYEKFPYRLYTTDVTKKKMLQQNVVHDGSRSVTDGVSLSVSQNWSTAV